MRHLATIFLIFSSAIALIAQPTQTIRGSVIHQFTNLPIPFASISQMGSKNPFGTTTDSSGNFIIANIPVGRYNLKVSCIGYDELIINEVIVSSAKETVLLIELKESITMLDEVEISPRISKEQPLNTMSTASVRMLSVEEAKRYAGGFDDPARLASSFAGVAGNTGENGIIVRGNAPKFLQWKMEGIEIPNPNHFGDLKSYGGGIFTALSSQLLANSDFLTGAFPAEYSNAISGIFDFFLRTGNNHKREHTFQIGIVGIDASAEGPFKTNGKASYLFNYRYSSLALLKPLLPDGANGLKYQDLSFKLNFPTRKAGTFTLWGIGLLDHVESKAKADSTQWKYYDDKENNQIRLSSGSSGIGHKIFLNNNSYLKTTLAATTSYTKWKTEAIDNQHIFKHKSDIMIQASNFFLTSSLNKTFGTKHTNRTGISVRGMSYKLLLNKTYLAGETLKEIVNTQDFSTLLSAYTSSSFYVSDKLTINAGVTGQVFTLNNHFTIEPRLGVSYTFKENQRIGMAYGLHSRLEPLNFYLNNDILSGEKAVNKNLDFTKAHHFVLSYDWSISSFIHFKIEPYYQFLFSVPVSPNSSFSVLNLQTDWFFSGKLQNTGEGKNYGIDLTLEKYISNGYYYMLTASGFKSEYKGGDDTWRSTRYNRNFVYNFLVGKEWQTGNDKQNVISVNLKASYQGGNRYSPINTDASNSSKDVVYDETHAYSMKMQPSLYVHFTAIYKINKPHSSREIALKIINITQQPDFNGFKYNYINGSVDKDLSKIVLPNLSYKIEF
jgi:hypothetical protein